MMWTEEKIQQELTGKFAFLDGKIKLQRPRRLWVDAPAEHFDAIFSHLVRQMDFPVLLTITGLDETSQFCVIYHLAQLEGIVCNLKVVVPKDNPTWKSVGTFFPGGIIYERELVDLLGLKIEGLPPGNRYPLPDDWPDGQFPLRKDWKRGGEAAIKEKAS
ncbi:MAG: NADH-quinone oxidoreductase subunit C [Verrucomicrobiae bacterium]|nr:NADH-quinone oxidoreductase subunit C [Verrucomicrobiae bacterium]